MTTPNIRHASNCADPKLVELVNEPIWESMVGQMRRLIVGCPTCGEAAQIERFEAAQIEEED